MHVKFKIIWRRISFFYHVCLLYYSLEYFGIVKYQLFKICSKLIIYVPQTRRVVGHIVSDADPICVTVSLNISVGCFFSSHYLLNSLKDSNKLEMRKLYELSSESVNGF